MIQRILNYFAPKKERHYQADKVNDLLKKLARDAEGIVLLNPSTLMHSRAQRTMIRDSLVELINNTKKVLNEINRIPIR